MFLFPERLGHVKSQSCFRHEKDGDGEANSEEESVASSPSCGSGSSNMDTMTFSAARSSRSALSW